MTPSASLWRTLPLALFLCCSDARTITAQGQAALDAEIHAFVRQVMATGLTPGLAVSAVQGDRRRVDT